MASPRWAICRARRRWSPPACSPPREAADLAIPMPGAGADDEDPIDGERETLFHQDFLSAEPGASDA